MKKDRTKCQYCQKIAVSPGTDEPCAACRREHLRMAAKIRASRPIEPSNMTGYVREPRVIATPGIRIGRDW